MQVRAAGRANRRHHERRIVTRRIALFSQDADDFRNDVACTPDDHQIANPNIEPGDLIGVVQGDIGDRDAADGHRLQSGYGRHRAGAADLQINRLQPGSLLLGREFVRQCPARGAGNKAHGPLLGEIIQLVDHAVDVVRQLLSTLANPSIVIEQTIQPCGNSGLRTDWKTQLT